MVPTQLGKLMSDPSKSEAVMEAMLTMQKIDIGQLQAARENA